MVYNLVTIKPKLLPGSIEQHIQAAFRRHSLIDASKIKVEILGNKAILSGNVRSFTEREDAVWASPGINAVDNNLLIVEEDFANN